MNTEMIAVGNRAQELEKHVHLLRKLGIPPEAILVVVFQTQDDVVLARDRKDLVDAFNDPRESLLAANLRIALAGKDPTDGALPRSKGLRARLRVFGHLHRGS